MTKVIYQEPLPASLSRCGIYPATASIASDGSLHFSVAGNTHPTWKPVVDFLPEHIPDLVEALAKHLGWAVATKQEIIDSIRDDPAPSVTPESIGVVDGKAPGIDKEPLRFWPGGTEVGRLKEAATSRERRELVAILRDNGTFDRDARNALANAIESGAL